MARIVFGSYMVRYPLGGMMSCVLQWLVGLSQLGHEVYFVEKAGYPNSCYDPVADVMSDDCNYGTNAVADLLSRFGFRDKWCFVDAQGCYYGMERSKIEAIFESADLFIDMGTHGAWLQEAMGTGLCVLVDGEPAFTQMKMAKRLADGETLQEYDAYYTVGRNIGTDKSSAPTAERKWRWVFNLVVPEIFPFQPTEVGAPFTTVMNWQAHEPIEYDGIVYGQKDIEFEKFVDLPRTTMFPLEIAVSGKNVPSDRLIRAGWRVRDAHAATISFDSFRKYIIDSRGEFCVCKNVFVATNSGWFSDRSAAYLASGRPVILQETGFSDYLSCGEGLFAVRTLDDAMSAIEKIASDYKRNSRRAREIANEFLDARKLLQKLLSEMGI